MRRRRLKRRLFWAGVLVAVLLFLVTVSVLRLGVWTRDLVARKARSAGLPGGRAA